MIIHKASIFNQDMQGCSSLSLVYVRIDDVMRDHSRFHAFSYHHAICQTLPSVYNIPLFVLYVHAYLQHTHTHTHTHTVKQVPEAVILIGAIDPSQRYSFCMCNPPFFKDRVEKDIGQSRSGHRPPPSTVGTGSEGETVVEGGEVGFVRRMVDDSLKLRDAVRYVCSTVAGCITQPLLCIVFTTSMCLHAVT